MDCQIPKQVRRLCAQKGGPRAASEPRRSKAGVLASGAAWCRNVEPTQGVVMHAVVGAGVGVKPGLGVRGQAA